MIAKLKEDPKENEASMKGPKPTLKSTPVPVAAPVLNLDGSSILKDKDKKKIGMLQSDGTLVDLKGKPFGKASLETGKITDGANMLLAWFKVMVSSKPQKKSCFGTIELSIQLDRRF